MLADLSPIFYGFLFLIWMLCSVVLDIRSLGFKRSLKTRIARDEAAIGRLHMFSLDALKMMRRHLDRELASLTARRATGLYMLGTSATAVTIAGIFQRVPREKLLGHVPISAWQWFTSLDLWWLPILAAVVLTGLLIGGFANHVYSETLGRLIFLVGEAERRKTKKA